jgi:hypothetical protein
MPHILRARCSVWLVMPVRFLAEMTAYAPEQTRTDGAARIGSVEVPHRAVEERSDKIDGGEVAMLADCRHVVRQHSALRSEQRTPELCSASGGLAK